MNRFAFSVMVCLASVNTIAGSEQDDTARTLLTRASRAASEGKSAEAVRLATAAIDAGDVDAAVYRLRGREYFRIGKMKESIADFDRYAELRPRHQTSLWERGISCYYAGQYAAGAKQFEDYQTYHSDDVENAVWHVLCNSKVKGLEAATPEVLPIRRDRRVPMMTIYEMFRGKAQPEDVMKRANSSGGDSALFYAHLYVGLFYEARGEQEKAEEHISTAAEKHRIDHYMWDVARIHAERFKGNTPTKSRN